MTDRCSAEVALTPTFDDQPSVHGTKIFARGQDNSTPPACPVTLDELLAEPPNSP
jgi:hypothetical protein